MSTFYGSVIDADTYNLERGRIEWATLDEEQQEAELLNASEYLDNTYGMSFSGTRTDGRDQERQWPRIGAFATEGNMMVALPDDSVPSEVERATYELAYRNVLTPGVLSQDFNASEGIKSARVEGAVSVEFHGDGSMADSLTVFPTVDAILAPLLNANDSGGSSSYSGVRYRI